MKNNKFFIAWLIIAFSFVFILANFIPLLGPILMGYVLGLISVRYDEKYGFSGNQRLLSITIGELLFFIIITLFLGKFIDVWNLEIFWRLSIIGFISNYVLAIIFYFRGNVRAEINELKENVPITITFFGASGWGGVLSSLTYEINGRKQGRFKNGYFSEKYPSKFARRIAIKYERPVILEWGGEIIAKFNRNGDRAS